MWIFNMSGKGLEINKSPLNYKTLKNKTTMLPKVANSPKWKVSKVTDTYRHSNQQY